MIKEKIAIIGVGNMGKAFAQGLLRSKTASSRNLILANPTLRKLKEFEREGTTMTTNNRKACKQADVIIFAVKPQILANVLKEVKAEVSASHLILSLAGGVRIKSISKIIGKDKAILRIMPNLGARVGLSMSGWFKNENVTQKQAKIIQTILRAVGKEIMVKDEKDLDAVTAVSGSGPAYFFYLVECLIDAAQNLGLDKKSAEIIIYQTFNGAALLLAQSQPTPKQLRKAVTSKGGTTEAAIKYFEKRKLKGILGKGIQAAYKRSLRLAS